jgi:hypothetical protein
VTDVPAVPGVRSVTGFPAIDYWLPYSVHATACVPAVAGVQHMFVCSLLWITGLKKNYQMLNTVSNCTVHVLYNRKCSLLD